eukprot:CAMPEP_0196579988 /NCGR_PEP_ID=MMETSP1081-20130531/26116_1 /TAXON_ID=36882 /ORGANISM="Pyramimonas amylifera, Strain CCMP720" /LENGTH=307 /DNA_ID=CAMNT_0041899731 /DNA_START=310 /DNA_END=1233 /DNA_ORIENTATION=+
MRTNRERFFLLACNASSTVATTDFDNELSEILKVACLAAAEGGQVIRDRLGAEVIKTKGNSQDLLTEVDAQVQTLLHQAQQQAFPHHSFLGEESVSPGPVAAAAALEGFLEDPNSPDWLWLVDPIDGTTNFVQSIPLSTISIGVAYKGEVVAGVILDPFRDECFFASKGKGAFCNGRPIQVGAVPAVGDAVVSTGFGATGSSGPMLRGMNALTELPVRSIRMMGSAAIMFAWIGCGRLTAYFEVDLNVWDIAAGAIIVKEAGGKMSNINGEDYSLRTRCILASNGKTHDELMKALQEANCLSLDSQS